MDVKPLISRVSLGGVFQTEIRRHRLLSKALETGDPERVSFVQKLISSMPRNLALYDTVDVAYDPNIVVNEGINRMLSTWLAGGAQTSLYYISLFSSNSTPTATWTLPTYRSTNATEWTNYSEAARPAWAAAAPSSQTITNSASPAVFTATAGATIYGAVLCNASNKSGTGDATGFMVAATRYASARALLTNDVASVSYTISATST
jgi:hypothetical protein